MKSFKSYLKEYGTHNPSYPMGGNSSGPGMGQYVPSADLNLRAQKKKNPRIPRKKGQPAGSDKHSDLYTDENPKGTIQGLGFKDVATAKASRPNIPEEYVVVGKSIKCPISANSIISSCLAFTSSKAIPAARPPKITFSLPDRVRLKPMPGVSK